MVFAWFAVKGIFRESCGEHAETIWLAHKARLASMEQWVVNGRLAYRSADKGGSAFFFWSQEGNRFTIRLSGPLVSHPLVVAGDQHKATMRITGGAVETATTADELVARSLGWTVPLGGLTYWVRGLPAPGIPVRMHLRRDGFLDTLDQSGWHIVYSDYQRAGEWTLPRRIVLQRARVSVRLAVDRWQGSRME